MLRLNRIQRSAAEFIGTGFLVAAIIGSGIMAQKLCQGNTGLMLLANAIATAGALFALIAAFAAWSGAHFNPVVTLAEAFHRRLPWGDVPFYIVAQFGGAFAGAAIANAMFGLPAIFFSHHVRSGVPQLWSESLATFGLLLVIWGCSRAESRFTPFAVAGYIAAAYWFTPSTSFANPAVTFGRIFSDTFAGIRAADALPFIGAQLAGGIAGAIVLYFLLLEPQGEPIREQA